MNHWKIYFQDNLKVDNHSVLFFREDAVMEDETLNTGASQDMGADGSQPSLFPEDDDGAGGGDNGIAQQLMSMTPEALAQMASTLDPDVKMSLAQALFSTMSPEEKQQLDTVPAGDVADNMEQAQPQKPELMYQMSVVRAQKKCAATPGMEALCNDHLDKWLARVDSLEEDGYLSQEKAAKFRKDLDKSGQNRFSIILDNHGLLRDTCVAIKALEESRAGQATLSKSVLQGISSGNTNSRFSAARPVKRSTADEPGAFDRKAAEEAGTRLSKL